MGKAVLRTSRASLASLWRPFVAAALACSALTVGAQATDQANEARAEIPTPTLAPMLARVLPGVVGISIVQDAERSNPLLRDPFFRQFFEDSARNKSRRPALSEARPAGSGVIVDAGRGLVLTNHHVIREASRVVVVLNDRRELNARVLGSDAGTDIALLKVEASGLVGVPIGDSDTMRVGDFVVAIGNPFGIGQTVTSGIVSAVGRGGLSPEGYEDYIQTDAAINPGNSGGALVNLRGQLIGVNTAILTGGQGSHGNIGIGFAVPMSMARQVIAQIQQHGEVRRGRIGVQAADLTPQAAESRKLGVKEGALLTTVEAGSPAQQAGLRAEDVVVSVNGRPVRGNADLRNCLALISVGSVAELVAWRGASRLSFAVTVAAISPPASAASRSDAGPPKKESAAGNWGLQLAPAGDGTLAVVEVAAQGRAHALGLRAGDHILAVNREPVASVEVFTRLLAAAGEKTLSVLRGETKLRITVP